MSKGCYTELFFWDEATALSAGHRPCAECQRGRFNIFKGLWKSANNQLDATTGKMDEFLHFERESTENSYLKFNELPDGAMFEYDGKPFLVYKNQMCEWTFSGYLSPIEPLSNISFRVLTPFSIIKTIQAGYAPTIIL